MMSWLSPVQERMILDGRTLVEPLTRADRQRQAHCTIS